MLKKLRQVEPERLVNDLCGSLFKAGMSDSELAEQTGLSRSRVNLLKNRRVIPTVCEGLLISSALGVEVEDMFQLREEFPGDGETVKPGAEEGGFERAGLFPAVVRK